MSASLAARSTKRWCPPSTRVSIPLWRAVEAFRACSMEFPAFIQTTILANRSATLTILKGSQKGAAAEPINRHEGLDIFR